MLETRNLLEIHNSILQYFKNEEKLLPILEQRIKEIEYIKDSVPIHFSAQLNQEFIDMKVRYKEISKKENLYYYLLQSTILIDEYKNELNKPIEVNFMGQPISNANSHIIERITDQFISMAKDIIPIHMKEMYISDTCSVCEKVSGEHIIETTNTTACNVCGTEKDSLQNSFSYQDTERVNITSKYQYARRIHFKECINQFQGKQNSTIKPEIYEKLIQQLELHGLVHSENVPQKIKYEKVTKYHISIFLKEIGYSNHYEDLNLIYHNITGNELDDISHLEDILMEDFDQLNKLYDDEYIKTRKIIRKNFINTQYVLYQLLKRHKYPCSQNDFTFLKTIERKVFHDGICSHLFKKLGWNFQPIF